MSDLTFLKKALEDNKKLEPVFVVDVTCLLSQEQIDKRSDDLIDLIRVVEVKLTQGM